MQRGGRLEGVSFGVLAGYTYSMLRISMGMDDIATTEELRRESTDLYTIDGKEPWLTYLAKRYIYCSFTEHFTFIIFAVVK